MFPKNTHVAYVHRLKTPNTLIGQVLKPQIYIPLALPCSLLKKGESDRERECTYDSVCIYIFWWQMSNFSPAFAGIDL